ncbi:MAG: hypothetical protein ACRDUY_08015 [Nitriliruptorales bacterium]
MSDPVERLPPVYARYLRLRAAGRSTSEIAAELDVPPQSLDLLDVLAREKLERLKAAGDGEVRAT